MGITYTEMAKQVEQVSQDYVRRAINEDDPELKKHFEAMAVQAMMGQIEMQKVLLLAAILNKMPEKDSVAGMR